MTKIAEKNLRSKTILVCPVSGERQVIPAAAGTEGTWEVDENAEIPNLPVNWGWVYIAQVVPNPKIAKAKEARAKDVEEAMAGYIAMSEDPDRPEAERAIIQREIHSGAALEFATSSAKTKWPLPKKPLVVLRLQFPTLAPDGLGALMAAIKAAGFPIND